MTVHGVMLDHPWLSVDLGGPMQVLSWSLNRPGFVQASRFIWREVRNADLPPDLDVRAWLNAELVDRGDQNSIAFLTSCQISRYQVAQATVGESSAKAIVTLGLSNAEHVGHRQRADIAGYGTINIGLVLNVGLRQSALVEALSIAVQARTAAVLAARIVLPTGYATGTGTDCIAVAAPEGATEFAGLHTEIGEAIGRAVFDATSAGAAEWLADHKEQQHA